GVVVTVITDMGNSVFFGADAGSKAMKGMLCFGPLLESELLKVPHHGGQLGDMRVVREFIEEVGCKHAVVSTSAGYAKNRELFEKLKEQDTNIYMTSDHGAVIAEETEDGFFIRPFCRRP
ncbi:MAG: hypothetical protein KAS86_01710, partial [Candidatus Omnitrophica bacterium]|nr:hypothetical protein [Candidatus Omnitrophota bacterium]